MKLAEALTLRADMQTKIDSLHQRVLRNLKVQEGEVPHEDPEALLSQLRALYGQHLDLVQRINARNNIACLPNGRVLCDALAERESLLKRRNALASIISQASERDLRLMHAEIRTRVTVSVADLQKEADDLSRRHRELDTLIQGLNWTVDL